MSDLITDMFNVRKRAWFMGHSSRAEKVRSIPLNAGDGERVATYIHLVHMDGTVGSNTFCVEVFSQHKKLMRVRNRVSLSEIKNSGLKQVSNVRAI